jgi:phage terminase large subunit-like protein
MTAPHPAPAPPESPSPAEGRGALCGYAPLLRAAVRHFDGDDEGLAAWVESLPRLVVERLKADWWWQAHGGQREPEGEWRVWLLMAGRGFGKTRAGAEWVWARARETPRARIALVGGNRDDVAKVMIEGTSGLIRTARPGEEVEWKPSLGRLRFGSDAEAFVYSAEAPEALRGPEHHFAWADELAKWGRPSMYGRPGPGSARAEAAWDNLMMGLRLGDDPKCVVTTTPRPVPLLRRVIALDGSVMTRGRMDENVHLPPAFVAHMRATYGGGPPPAAKT